MIQYTPLLLFFFCLLNNRLVFHSFCCSAVAVASYVRNCFLVSRRWGYIRSNHLPGLPYDKIIITIVERDTQETSLVHCLRYCYSCFALITILGNELVILPGIMFYYGNNYVLSKCVTLCEVFINDKFNYVIETTCNSNYHHTTTEPKANSSKVLVMLALINILVIICSSVINM